jgi:hypothetical protein
MRIKDFCNTESEVIIGRKPVYEEFYLVDFGAALRVE